MLSWKQKQTKFETGRILQGTDEYLTEEIDT